MTDEIYLKNYWQSALQPVASDDKLRPCMAADTAEFLAKVGLPSTQAILECKRAMMVARRGPQHASVLRMTEPAIELFAPAEIQCLVKEGRRGIYIGRHRTVYTYAIFVDAVTGQVLYFLDSAVDARFAARIPPRYFVNSSLHQFIVFLTLYLENALARASDMLRLNQPDTSLPEDEQRANYHRTLESIQAQVDALIDRFRQLDPPAVLSGSAWWKVLISHINPEKM